MSSSVHVRMKVLEKYASSSSCLVKIHVSLFRYCLDLYRAGLSIEIKDFLFYFGYGSCPVFVFIKKSLKKLAGHEREEYGNY